MATPHHESLLDQQKQAVYVLIRDGLAAYEQYLQILNVSDFLNGEEKNYFVSSDLGDFSDSDDEEGEPLICLQSARFQDAGDYCSLEVDGGTPYHAESAELKIETRVKFSPGICEEIFKMIGKCSHSIKIAMFMFTEKSIFKKLCKKKKSNPEIDIFILVDKSQFDDFLVMAKKVIKNDFKNKEIGIKVNAIMKKGNNQGKMAGKAHEKFMVVDESSALTGSYNFTWSSEYSNYEQVIISNDHEAIVNPLLKHFKKMSKKIKYETL